MAMQARPPGKGKARLTCCSVECSLRGLRALIFEGLLGGFFFLLVGYYGCSCVLRGAFRFFYKILLLIKKKKNSIVVCEHKLFDG
jgi:hypothetical protein